MNYRFMWPFFTKNSLFASYATTWSGSSGREGWLLWLYVRTCLSRVTVVTICTYGGHYVDAISNRYLPKDQ